MAATGRPTFDALDALQVERYLHGRKWAVLDPLSDDASGDDVIMRTSLEGARFLFEQSFGTVNAAGQSFRAYPFFVARPSANAFAVEHEGLQLCGIDMGLVTAAFEMSLFVFAQAALFAEVGDAAREVSPTLPDDAQLAFWIADRLRAGPDPEGRPFGIELMPRDEQRQLAAYFLTQLLLRFVWLHEFYHCLNGHTGLVASERSGAVLNEMQDEDGLDLELIEVEPRWAAAERQRLRHAMEYDADRSALWMLVRLQQIDLEPVAGLSAWPRPFRLKLAIFAAAIMTFLFDQAARRQAKRTTATHPTAQYRLVDLVRTLASHLVDPPGETRQAFKAVLAEMTALQQRLPSFVSGTRLLHDIGSPPLQQQLDEMDDALTAARVRFAPFAYRHTPV